MSPSFAAKRFNLHIFLHKQVSVFALDNPDLVINTFHWNYFLPQKYPL